MEMAVPSRSCELASRLERQACSPLGVALRQCRHRRRARDLPLSHVKKWMPRMDLNSGDLKEPHPADAVRYRP